MVPGGGITTYIKKPAFEQVIRRKHQIFFILTEVSILTNPMLSILDTFIILLNFVSISKVHPIMFLFLIFSAFDMHELCR